MSELDSNTMGLLKLLWQYNKIGRPPQAADFLLVMGTNDTAVAEYAASLAATLAYRFIVVSGGVHHDLSLRGISPPFWRQPGSIWRGSSSRTSPATPARMSCWPAPCS